MLKHLKNNRGFTIMNDRLQAFYKYLEDWHKT
jgi:hypothetical protein